MANIVNFPLKAARDGEPRVNSQSAAILMFTGVRYERLEGGEVRVSAAKAPRKSGMPPHSKSA